MEDDPNKVMEKILQDCGHMCLLSMEKTQSLWKRFEENKSFTTYSLSLVKSDLDKLLDRIVQNAECFKKELQKCAPKHKLENGDVSHEPSKKKSKLSLLHLSDDEEEVEPQNVLKKPEFPVTIEDDIKVEMEIKQQLSDSEDEIKVNGKNQSTVLQSDDGDSDDSDRTIPLGNLDIPAGKNMDESFWEDRSVINKKDIDDDDDDKLSLSYFDTSDVANNADLHSSLDERSFKETKDEAEAKFKADFLSQLTESENSSKSFDFDDYCEDDVRNKQENQELLQCLEANEKTDDDLLRPLSLDEEAELALKDLEFDDSAPITNDLSDSDTEDTFDSTSSLQKIINSDDSDDEASEEENQNASASENIVTSDVVVKLRPFDSLNDSEIDRLCDLNSLDKNTCKNALKQLRIKKLVKRMRKASSSSTASLSSLSSNSSDTSLCCTPEIKLPEIGNAKPVDEKQVLAEMACDDLLREDSGSISSSIFSSDEENKVTEEKEKPKPTASVNESKPEDPEKEPYKRSKWRTDPLLNSKLWSSDDENTSTSSSDFETDNKEEKPKIKRQRKHKDTKDTTVISSGSDSSFYGPDSDVEFISELEATESLVGSSGRRRNIRAIMDDEELTEASQRAKIDEHERIQRLEVYSKTMESIQSQHEEFVLDADINTSEPLVVVNRVLAQKLKPHQRSGVEFMWKACYESVEQLKKNKGTGCILAHCMGLGKTLQVITLIHTLFNHPVTETKHVLIICPISTISNWRNEFKMAFEQLPPEQTRIQLNFLINQSRKIKVGIIEKWHRRGGVLLMSYECYVTFVGETKVARMNLHEESQKQLKKALTNPGPDLIVCDEGHFIKNSKACRSQALMSVKTKRRIVLTGTPLQNNLMEYYCMVDFISPNLLGTEPEYKNRFSNPITNGQYQDSTPEDIKLMKKRTHVLNKLLKMRIHRAESKELQQYLPEICDYTLYVTLHEKQIECYEKFIESVRAQYSAAKQSFFSHFLISKYIALHPYTVHRRYEKKENATKKNKEKETITLNPEDDPDLIETVTKNTDWFKDIYTPEVFSEIETGTKLMLILEIIDETIRHGDKILIFSMSLEELDTVEHFLCTVGTKDHKNWMKNVNYFRLDGRVEVAERSILCDRFNDPKNTTAKVFLMTQKVGGLGLNLTGANRVILISANYNPSIDEQSIYRVFRFGQTKPSFVYRLLTMGTMEEKMYQRCVVKLTVSETVIDKKHIRRRFRQNFMQAMYEYDFKTQQDKQIPLVPKDKLLAKLLQNCPYIFHYEQHRSLFDDNPEEELNDEEKKSAWDEFNTIEEVTKSSAVPLAPPPPTSIKVTLPATSANPCETPKLPPVYLTRLNGNWLKSSRPLHPPINANQMPQDWNLPSTSTANANQPLDLTNITSNITPDLNKPLPQITSERMTNGIPNNQAYIYHKASKLYIPVSNAPPKQKTQYPNLLRPPIAGNVNQQNSNGANKNRIKPPYQNGHNNGRSVTVANPTLAYAMKKTIHSNWARQIQNNDQRQHSATNGTHNNLTTNARNNPGQGNHPVNGKNPVTGLINNCRPF